MIMKTHKTVSKRIKVTKSGKLLKRKAGQDHFNARERGKTTRGKRRDISVNASYEKSIKHLM